MHLLDRAHVRFFTGWTAHDRFFDGAIVGAIDGAIVGSRDGAIVGAIDGAIIGSKDGAIVGLKDGAIVGSKDGAIVGAMDGALDGSVVVVVLLVPIFIINVLNFLKFSTPRPVTGSHPGAAEKPSRQQVYGAWYAAAQLLTRGYVYGKVLVWRIQDRIDPA